MTGKRGGYPSAPDAPAELPARNRSFSARNRLASRHQYTAAARPPSNTPGHLFVLIGSMGVLVDREGIEPSTDGL